MALVRLQPPGGGTAPRWLSKPPDTIPSARQRPAPAALPLERGLTDEPCNRLAAWREQRHRPTLVPQTERNPCQRVKGRSAAIPAGSCSLAEQSMVIVPLNPLAKMLWQ